MLHPALAQALAAARIEDQQRAAARMHTIRLARASARGSRRPVDEADRRSKEPGPIGRPSAACLVPHAGRTAPMSTCVPVPERRPRYWLHARLHPRARASADDHDLGALAGELDRCCTSIPAGHGDA